jgi:hypothetical protein
MELRPPSAMKGEAADHNNSSSLDAEGELHEEAAGAGSADGGDLEVGEEGDAQAQPVALWMSGDQAAYEAAALAARHGQ